MQFLGSNAEASVHQLRTRPAAAFQVGSQSIAVMAAETSEPNSRQLVRPAANNVTEGKEDPDLVVWRTANRLAQRANTLSTVPRRKRLVLILALALTGALALAGGAAWLHYSIYGAEAWNWLPIGW